MTLKGLTRSLNLLGFLLFAGAIALMKFSSDEQGLVVGMIWNGAVMFLLAGGFASLEKRLVEIEKKVGLRSNISWESD